MKHANEIYDGLRLQQNVQQTNPFNCALDGEDIHRIPQYAYVPVSRRASLYGKIARRRPLMMAVAIMVAIVVHLTL